MKSSPIKMFKKLALATAVTSVAVATTNLYAAELEEIIVTAQKRAESLQDVSVSITAISGSRIEEAGLHNFQELANHVPNLIVSENAVATSFVLRGVGPGAQQSFEQSVGLFVDGVHLPKGRQARLGLFDLEVVEVLRGPQGILFGKNTLAGAINVTSGTPIPGDPLNGRIAIGVESFGGFNLEGHIEGSLSDELAVRLAYKKRETDGYLDNSFPGSQIGPNAVGDDENLFRFSATWEPNDSTTVKFKHAYGDIVRTGSTAVISTFAPTPNLSGANALFFSATNSFPQISENATNGTFDAFRDSISLGGAALAESLGTSFRSGVARDNSPEALEGTDTQNNDTSLNVDIEFGDGYTFSSVTGFSSYEYQDGIDADFLPVQFVGRSDISEYEKTSQEFRVASDPSKRFSFIAGAYWENQIQEIDRVVAFDATLGIDSSTLFALSQAALDDLAVAAGITDPAGNPLPAGVDGLTSFDQSSRVSNWRQETDSWAVFFQGEYRITDNLTVIGGLRYTTEDKSATANTLLASGASGLTTPLPPVNSLLLELILDGGNLPIEPHNFAGERTTDRVTPALTLEWDAFEDTLFYASYTEGFKSGGFNSVDDQSAAASETNPLVRAATGVGTIATTPGAGFEYDDEDAISFEIGGKHTFFNNSLNFNWAAFASRYDNQQVSTFVGFGFIVTNAASSDVNGFETELLWQATDYLKLGLNFAYLDATFGSFDTAGCTALQDSATALINPNTGLITSDPTVGVRAATSSGACTVNTLDDGSEVAQQNLTGAQLSQAPEFSGSFTANYERPFNDSMSWFVDFNVNFSDSYFLTGDADPIDTQDAFAKYNLSVGFRGEDWGVTIFGRNLSDEITANSGFDVPLAPGVHAVYSLEPRVWGARVSYSFGN